MTKEAFDTSSNGVSEAGESGRYRKRPVVIDAVLWDGKLTTVEPLLQGASTTEVQQELADPALIIPTLEGDMRAEVGDWIIRGINGELYPCKPDIFAATYEPADAPPEAALPVAVKELDEDQIMEIIKEVAPWKDEPKLKDLLTYEKSPPLFPQATYDVPSYRALKFVRAVEARIRSALVPQQAIDPAPGHTDLMVTPEEIDRFVEANPPPDGPACYIASEHLRRMRDGEACVTAILSRDQNPEAGITTPLYAALPKMEG